MAITGNLIKSKDIDNSLTGVDRGSFTATKSDTNYLADPADATKPIVSKGISVDRVDEAVKVQYSSGTTDTIEAGMLAAGVVHPLHIVQVFSTGTGSNVKVKIWY